MSDGDRMAEAPQDARVVLAEHLSVYDGFTADDERPRDYSTGIPTLRFLTAALRRSMWLWCITAVAGLLIGLGLFFAHPPPFQASTKVVLQPDPVEQATTAILTDVALAESRTVAERATHQLGLRQSATSFLAAYTVTALTDRVLLITADAPSSSEAVARASALATQFLRLRAQQAEAQEQHVLAELQQQVTLAKQRIKSIRNEIGLVATQPGSPEQQSKLASLRAQFNHASSQLDQLVQTVTTEQANARLSATQMVQNSKVLDPAAPIPHSRFKLPALYACTGLIMGLVLGVGFVVVRALVSDRLRRRDDVAHALGASVTLSVGSVRAAGWLPTRRGLAAAQGRDVRRIAAHLRDAVPRSRGRAGALAVVAVDDARVAALSLASLAVSCAREGNQVVIADLVGGAPAARLLGAGKPGIRPVRVNSTHLVVAVPGRDNITPTGPFPQTSPRAQPAAPSEALTAAYAAADLILILARLDPALGGEHLATWADDAVVMVTAGRSSWTKIHAVGEMIRLAGMRLASAVLVGTDKTDESLGVTHPPTPPAPVAVP